MNLNQGLAPDTPCVSPHRRWIEYCTSSHPFYSTLRAVLTGFVPALLIQLWQVGVKAKTR